MRARGRRSVDGCVRIAALKAVSGKAPGPARYRLFCHNFVIIRSDSQFFGVSAVKQIAALPYRPAVQAGDGSVEVLLVTSRGTGRWVVPKGNLGKREEGHAAAAREALEEAGVTGVVDPASIGSYFYRKILRSGAGRRTEVLVYPLAVTTELPEWAESGERIRRWCSPEEAADLVDEPDLGALIRSFRV